MRKGKTYICCSNDDCETGMDEVKSPAELDAERNIMPMLEQWFKILEIEKKAKSDLDSLRRQIIPMMPYDKMVIGKFRLSKFKVYDRHFEKTVLQIRIEE